MRKNYIQNIDWNEGLKNLPDKSVHCIVTSPPYWGLRDYGVRGQLGLEKTPEEFIEKIVHGFSIAKDKLRDDGTLWLNLGDSYAGSGKAKGDKFKNSYKQDTNRAACVGNVTSFFTSDNYKAKDLIGIPWMVAFALRAAGWYLRQDIIWHKPNPMPESVTDRCTKAHEYIFLFSKRAKYYYDADAIKTELKADAYHMIPKGWAVGNGPHSSIDHATAEGQKRKMNNLNDKNIGGSGKGFHAHSENFTSDGKLIGNGKANKRSVWSVNPIGFSDAHFATFPEDLIIDCIKAGSPTGGIILDPFMGAGTTALVAQKLNRNFVGFELNREYINIANRRLKKELGLFHPDNMEQTN